MNSWQRTSAQSVLERHPPQWWKASWSPATGILASNIGISPVSDGRVIRLPVPELSAERRAELTKVIKKRSEDAKVEIRNARRDSNEAIKKAQKASEITEDEAKAMTDKVQKLTDKMVEEVQKATDAKIGELERI